LRLKELFKCYKILIDLSVKDQLSVLVYYPKQRIAPGYKIYDIRYGPRIIINNSSSNAVADNSTNQTISVSTTQSGLTINNDLVLAPAPNITTVQSGTLNISSMSNRFI